MVGQGGSRVKVCSIDVVDTLAPAVHLDPDAGHPQAPGEAEAGELAALVGVEAPRHAMGGLLRGRHEGSPCGFRVANWRVTFRFEDGHVVDVDYLDYH